MHPESLLGELLWELKIPSEEGIIRELAEGGYALTRCEPDRRYERFPGLFNPPPGFPNASGWMANFPWASQ